MAISLSYITPHLKTPIPTQLKPPLSNRFAGGGACPARARGGERADAAGADARRHGRGDAGGQDGRRSRADKRAHRDPHQPAHHRRPGCGGSPARDERAHRRPDPTAHLRTPGDDCSTHHGCTHDHSAVKGSVAPHRRIGRVCVPRLNRLSRFRTARAPHNDICRTTRAPSDERDATPIRELYFIST